MMNYAHTIHNNLIQQSFHDAEYQTTHQAMLSRTLERIQQHKATVATDDELWIVEHQNVYTLGQAGKREHILSTDDTPIIKTDRGGQVTWHGTGQLVLYWLFDLHRLGWKVRDLVSHAEQAIEDVINQHLSAEYLAKARQDAPGVYIYHNEQLLGKIASLGFKIKHGLSYHGIAVNTTCDLTAFDRINPCGYAGMTMLRLADFAEFDPVLLQQQLIDNIADRHLGRLSLR